MPMGLGLGISPVYGGGGGSIANRPSCVFWTQAKGSAGALVDRHGHAIQHGSAPGADANDPLWLPYGGRQYLYCASGTGNAKVNDSVPLSVTGDLSLRAWVAADDWTPAAEMALIAKYQANASYRLSILAAGTLSLHYSTTGVNDLTATSTVAPTAADGAGLWVRVDRVSATGVVTFYTSPDGAVPVWTQLGTPVAGTSGALFDSADLLYLGSNSTDIGGNQYSGKFYRAQVYGDVAGADLRFDADFTDAAVVAEPYATFAEKSANAATVTIFRPNTGRKAVVVDRDLYSLGADDYFEIANAADLNFALTDPFTVCLLVRLYGATASQLLVAKKQDLTTGLGYSLDRGAAGVAPRFNIGDATFGPAGTVAALPVGTRTLVSGVRSVAGDTLTAYRDGTAGTPVTDTTTGTLLNAGVLRIGALGNGAAGGYGDFEFLGAAIFREALSAADLALVKAALLA